MNCQARLQIAIVIALLLSSSLVFGYGLSITATSPDSLPKGATVNDIDGDHHFMQALEFTMTGAGTAGSQTFTLTIPTGISLADPDGDSNYKDGISISVGAASETKAAATSYVYSASASSIVFKTDRISGGADTYSLVFPITTTLSAGDSVKYTLAVSRWGAYSTSTYVQFSRKTTSQDTSFLDLVTWDTRYDGTAGDSTNTEGFSYPSNGVKATMLSVALPDFVTDQTSTSGHTKDGSDTDFETVSFTLDNDDATDEVTYYVWGSQVKNLIQIRGEDADVTQSLTLVDALTRGSLSYVTTAHENDKFNVVLDTRIYDEGTWYFYLTSSLTADWVLGRSGAIKVTHRPTFISSTDDDSDARNESFGIDYDNDFVMEPDGDDDQSAITVDGSQALGFNGNIGTTGYSVDSLGIVYNIFDYDDVATIQIFKAAKALTLTSDSIYTSGTSPTITVDSLGGAVELTTTPLEDEETNQFFYYKPARSTTDYDAAGDFYLYAVANDGKWQVLKQMTNGAGTAMELHIKYFPKFVFDDYYTANKTFETNNEEYFIINWGTTITGDNEIDGTMKINLFASNLVYGSAGASATPASVDTSVLWDYSVNDPDGTIHIATILDTSDTKRNNRYMWDVRHAGLVDGTPYYLYAVITSPVPSGGRDAAIVTLNSEETMVVGTQRTLTPRHYKYLLPQAPEEGEVVMLDNGDTYDLRWNAFDMDANAADCEVAAFMVPTGTTVSTSTTWTQFMDNSVTGYYWILPATNGFQMDVQVRQTASTTFGSGNAGRASLSVADLDNDMAAVNDTPSGTYDVYYFFSNDGTWSTETPVQADGKLYFSDESSTNANFNWRLHPTVATIAKGDTITVSVYATDNNGTNNPMALYLYLNVPASAFEIVDTDTTTSWPGITPFTEVTGTFNGTVTKNRATLTNGVYQCDWETHYDNGTSSADLSSTRVAYMKLIARDDASADVLDEQIISFNTTGSRMTHMVTTSFVEFGQNCEENASRISMAPRGKFTGFVDLQAIDGDSGQVVNLYVCGVGGVDCITDSIFLANNNDTDYRDGIQYTLGANGQYTLTHIPQGKYDIICEKDGWLTRRLQNQTVQPHSTTTADFYYEKRLWAGDCGGYEHDGSSLTGTYPDNQISSADYDLVETYWDKTWKAVNDTGWHSYCDFNQDSVINVLDLQWPTTNYSAGHTSGDGITYKVADDADVSDENSQLELVIVDQVDDMLVYGAKSTSFANMLCYDVRVFINKNEWEMVAYENKFLSKDNIFFTKQKGFEYSFVSATLGYGVSPLPEQILFTFTLKPKVSVPSKPRIKNATFINSEHQVNAPVVHIGIDDNSATTPIEFSLSQNYPNPFNPNTTIKFAIPEAGKVKLIVYNMMGQQVRELITDKLSAGFYHVNWDGMNDRGSRVSTGMYLYRIQVDNKFVQTKKMMLLK
ncbi:T9SS type A sorting domain-containing protein [candidate division KSB1 bacterium]|nr:T9SS type A sorting domain-containing protein [candidate division KSB1 bacterium]